MLAELPRPTIFAHRGSSSYAPENTFAAFELAIQQGAHAIELDVMLSADNKVIVFHDHTVNRTTGISGYVRKMTLEELHKLDAGSYFGNRYRNEKIPLLEEVFSKLGRKVYFNLELKNLVTPTDSLPQETAELVKKYNLGGEVLFSSFNPLALTAIRRYLPKSEIGILVGRGFLGKIILSVFSRFIPHEALHTDVSITTNELVDKVHRHGHRIHVYTVNDAITMKKLLGMGIDGIITNDPLLAIRNIDSDGSGSL